MPFDEWYLSADPTSVGKVVDELFTEVLRLGDLTLSAVNENAFAQYAINDSKAFNEALCELGHDGQELLAWWLRSTATIFLARCADWRTVTCIAGTY